MSHAFLHLRANEVNVSILGDPIGATLWAARESAGIPRTATRGRGGRVRRGIFLARREQRCFPGELTGTFQ